MSALHPLIAFLLTAGLITITPGPDTVLVLRTVALEGSRQAFTAALGVVVGLLIWGCAVSVGLGALLTASKFAYAFLHIAGAIYLFCLGVGMIMRAIARANYATEETGLIKSEQRGGSWFVRGLINNLLNPKIGVFYITFLPQFLPPHANFIAFSMLLAALHAVEVISWFALLIYAARPLTHWLSQPRVRRGLEGTSGVVLAGFRAVLLART